MGNPLIIYVINNHTLVHHGDIIQNMYDKQIIVMELDAILQMVEIIMTSDDRTITQNNLDDYRLLSLSTCQSTFMNHC